MAARLRPAGLFDSVSDDEQYDAFITVETGGKMVMLSTKATYCLILFDEVMFSTFLLRRHEQSYFTPH